MSENSNVLQLGINFTKIASNVGVDIAELAIRSAIPQTNIIGFIGAIAAIKMITASCKNYINQAIDSVAEYVSQVNNNQENNSDIVISKEIVDSSSVSYDKVEKGIAIIGEQSNVHYD
jgi:hypothetical protein